MAAREGVKLSARNGGGESPAVGDWDDLVPAAVKDQEGTPIVAKGGEIIEGVANQEARREVPTGEGANTREGRLEDQGRNWAVCR